MDFIQQSDGADAAANIDEFEEGPDNIWIAASNNDIARVQKLLAEGISINSQDETGYSPMHAAVSYGHQKLITALLAAGADINIEDVDGDTPLLVCEDPEVFELLLKNGADVKKTNNLGWGILEKVIDDDNDVMIKYLIEYGHVDNPEMLAQILSGISVKSIEEGDEEEDDDEKEETDGTAKMSRLN